MTRLIDADALHTLFDDNCMGECECCDFFENCNGHYYCGLIDNAPTIEYSKNSLDYDYGFAEGCKRTREKYEGGRQ